MREVDKNNPVDHGGVLREEGLVLSALAAALGGPVLEIGGALGCSTRFILQGLAPDQLMVSVDVHHGWSCSDGRCQQVTADSRTFSSPFNFKWAFIDGDHSYEGAKADLQTCIRLGIKLLVFHDTGPSLETMTRHGMPEDGARRVVQELDENPKWELLELDTQCGLTIARHEDFSC